MNKQIKIVGLISDTHGLLREEAVRALRGADLILHAGDVGAPEILEALGTLAPVMAVRGNIDTAEWAQTLPTTAVAEVGPGMIYILHNLHDLDLNPAAGGFRAVVSGHSHQPGKSELSVASDGGAAGCGPASMGRGIHRAKSYIGIAADVDREAGTENRSGALRMFKN